MSIYIKALKIDTEIIIIGVFLLVKSVKLSYFYG